MVSRSPAQPPENVSFPPRSLGAPLSLALRYPDRCAPGQENELVVRFTENVREWMARFKYGSDMPQSVQVIAFFLGGDVSPLSQVVSVDTQSGSEILFSIRITAQSKSLWFRLEIRDVDDTLSSLEQSFPFNVSHA
jgi:hypothetical protein